MGILCMFDQINIVFGQFFQFLTVILTDPENKTLIGKCFPHTGHMVVNTRGNEDHIPRFQMVMFLSMEIVTFPSRKNRIHSNRGCDLSRHKSGCHYNSKFQNLWTAYTVVH